MPESSTKSVSVPLAQWLPDAPPLANQGLIEARNLYPGPTPTSFHALNSPTERIPTPAEQILGHTWANDASREIHNFAGTATALLKLGADREWDDVSDAGGYAAVTGWEFVKFGERVIAFAPEASPQYYDMGTSTLFADLPGSPPQARCAAVVRDFIVTGDLYGGSEQPYRVQWSGFFNSEIWTVGDQANQSDYQDFYGEGGRIQKIIGGDHGIIFQEHSIRIMQYVGGKTVFNFHEVHQSRGTPARGSVVRAGTTTFFYGWDGFCIIQGQDVKNIGAGRVNDWFRARVIAGSLQTKMTATIDRRRRLVMWSYPANGATENNETLIYNWASDRWSYASHGHATLSEWATEGYTLEELDTAVSTNLDTQTVSLDSDLYKGGDVNVIGFDTLGAGNLYEGTPGEALLIGGESVGEGGGRLFMTGIRPFVEDPAGTATVQVAVDRRDLLSAPVTRTPWVGLNPLGEGSLRVDSRYMRPVVRITGNFASVQAIEVLIRPSGKR